MPSRYRPDASLDLADWIDSRQYRSVPVTRPSPEVLQITRRPAERTELSAARAESLASTLKALADPVRLLLYSRIAEAGDEICVCDIQDVGVSQPTVSHHLRKLRDAGLIDCERRGTWVYYWAVPGSLDLLSELPRP